MSNTPIYKRSAGFALVASLLILVVLLVLGISAVSTVGLQEKMAGNLREKARATEAADMATRDAEQRVAGLTKAPLPGLEIADPIDNRNFLDPVFWSATDNNDINKTYVYQDPPFNDDALIGSGIDKGQGVTKGIAKYHEKPKSFSEYWRPHGYNLISTAIPDGEALHLFRLSGQGFGGNETAESVVQSIFTWRWQ